MSSNKQHLSTDLCEGKKFGDMFVIEPNATIGRLTTNFSCVVGAVDTVIGPAEVECMSAQRVIWAGANVRRPLWIALEH